MTGYDTVLRARRPVTVGREQAGSGGRLPSADHPASANGLSRLRPGPAGNRTGDGGGEDAGR